MTTAWILGNGPTLPVNDLYMLRGFFTVGVNRIHMSGFSPVVVMWYDGVISRDHITEIDASSSVIVCPKRLANVGNAARHHGVETKSGRNSGKYTSVNQIQVRGSMGASAARWALFLGFDPIYLLGMGAEEVNGRSHFYEPMGGRQNGRTTYLGYKQELDRLLSESAAYKQINTASELKESVNTYDGPYCVDWHTWIEGKLNENKS